MKSYSKISSAISILAILLISIGCSHKYSATSLNSYTTVRPNLVNYDEMTMNLDKEPITYTIDISTKEGELKLNKLNLEDAKDLVLVEAIMANRCAAIFQPQYTHLIRGGKILRITIYGYPARYKVKQ